MVPVVSRSDSTVFVASAGMQHALEEYRSGWSDVVRGATSGFMFLISCFVGYCCLRLMSPYMAGISFGILLSIVLHPKSSSKSFLYHSRECERRMKVTNAQWISVSGYYRWIGAILSLQHFILFVMMQGVHFLGLQKLHVGKRILGPNLEETKNGRDFLRILAMAVFLITSGILVGPVPLVLLHSTLLTFFVVIVHILPEGVFIRYCGRLWRWSVILFLGASLVYNFFIDVLVITEQVQKTTVSMVHSSRTMVADNNLTSVILNQIQSRLLEDVAMGLNANNVTQAAIQVREAFGPLIQNLTLDRWDNWTVIAQQLWVAMDNVSEESPFEALQAVAQQLGGKWKPMLDVLISIVLLALTNIVNIFDTIYEFVLFVFVYRFLTTFPHTVVYYVVSKILTPFNADFGARHAALIERDITMSFRTLFQSFWHITWLHFSVTFCAFRFWSMPLPFFNGMVAVAMALFPMVPKWFSPCSIAFGYLTFVRVRDGHLFASATLVDTQIITFLLAMMLVVNDEWLLSVERGLRGAKHHDASGVVREQLPTFVVGTCIILGIVSYGVPGIVLGPLTVIIARTIFDHWDVVWGSSFVQALQPKGQQTSSDPTQQQQAQGSGASAVKDSEAIARSSSPQFGYSSPPATLFQDELMDNDVFLTPTLPPASAGTASAARPKSARKAPLLSGTTPTKKDVPHLKKNA